MDGKEILNGMKEVYQKFIASDYPTNIFILTDGAVNNPDEVINFV
jgi:hypothetical protein